MAKGIVFPFQTNIRGGILVAEGPEILRQNILLGVKPAGSLNPWGQRDAPREDLVFDIADAAVGGELAAYVYDLFEDLQRLDMAKLPKDSNAVRTELSNIKNGDLEVVITYIDLEDNSSRQVRFRGVR